MSMHNKHRPSARATVSISAPDAKSVFVAGTFNDWNPQSHPLTHHGDGHWGLTLDLLPGRHEYKFISDGQWSREPGCNKGCQGRPENVANPFGTMNRVLIVGEAAGSPSQTPRPAATRPPAITTEYKPKAPAMLNFMASSIADDS